MTRIKWRVAAACVAVAGLASACNSAAHGGSGDGKQSGDGPTKVAIAIPAESAAASFIQVAVAAGITKKYNLDVTLNTSLPPATTPAALVSGSIQAAALTSTATQANGKGLPVVNVVTTGTHAPFVMLGAPGLKTIKDLVGKSVVTSAPTDTPGTETNEILQAAGIADQVKIVNVASVPGRSALFDSGKADAVYEALNLGLKDAAKRPGSSIIGDNKSTPITPADGLAVTKKFLSANRTAVAGLVKACMEAANMMKNQPDKAAPYLKKIYGLNDDEVKQFLDVQKGSLVITGQPSRASYANQAELFNKQPARGGKKVNWTADKVAASWDTSLAVSAAKTLGYSE